jgi:hypothetical protein
MKWWNELIKWQAGLTNGNKKKHPHRMLCGSYWIRTSDPLLVRQML